VVLSSGSPNARQVLESGDNVGDLAGIGSLTCIECGYALPLGAAIDDLPRCPTCGGSRFERASLFEQPTVDAAAVVPASTDPPWLADLRAEAADQEPCLAFEDEEGKPVLVALAEGWTRIGRSGTADVQLDDPTVSRRHALVVHTPDDELRALDDRSLNGLFVNGKRVEWAPLADGDELEIGRYRLYVITG
jgi:hypothetical protein